MNEHWWDGYVVVHVRVFHHYHKLINCLMTTSKFTSKSK